MLYVTSVTGTHSLCCDYVWSHLTIASYIPVYTQNVNRRIEIPYPSIERQKSWRIFKRLIARKVIDQFFWGLQCMPNTAKCN